MAKEGCEIRVIKKKTRGTGIMAARGRSPTPILLPP